MAATPAVLCPEIATPPDIVITIENVASLNLSTYARTPGTVVRATCLTAPSYVLHGANTLTCLSDGSWDVAIPECKPFQSGGTTTSGATGSTDSDIGMVPLIALLSILAAIFLAFVGVMVYVTCFWKRAGGCRRRFSKHPEEHALTLHEAEGIFMERRLARSPPSVSTENLDSVSQRCDAPQRNARSQRTIHDDEFAFARGHAHRGRSSHDRTTTNSVASFDQDPIRGSYFGHPTGSGDFKTRIGTRQTYRTWQDLFYSPDHY